jgi:hypothetical protein
MLRNIILSRVAISLTKHGRGTTQDRDIPAMLDRLRVKVLKGLQLEYRVWHVLSTRCGCNSLRKTSIAAPINVDAEKGVGGCMT